MPQSLHKHLALAQALGAGLLLGPFVIGSIQSDRWTILVLSFLSMLLIIGNAPASSDRNNWPLLLAAVAGSLVLAGVGLSIDKFQIIGGALFFCSAILTKTGVARAPLLAIIACACLMVPLPAAIETELAMVLANLEASLFVTLGQALGLPVRLAGAQIFFDQSVVTINQDCSGTLLLLPALLGAITAAALAKHRNHVISAMAMAVPLALLINLVRLGVVLGLMADGDYLSADQWHDALGYMALAFSWVLPLALFVDFDAVEFQSGSLKVFARVATLMIVGGAVTTALYLSRPSAEPPKLTAPGYVSGWVAESIDIPPAEARILNADQVSRHRYTSADDELLVTVIYHLDPKVGREHSSERCFLAMGWHVSKLASQPFRGPGLLTFLDVSSGGHRQSVIEFEIEDSGTSGGLLRVQLVSRPGLSNDQKRDLISLFANKILGEMV